MRRWDQSGITGNHSNVLPGVRDALTIGPQTAEFNSFISIEPGLPQPENSEALAAPEEADLKVGSDEEAPKAKAAPKPAKKPEKAAPAKASAAAAKPKPTAKPKKDDAKT